MWPNLRGVWVECIVIVTERAAENASPSSSLTDPSSREMCTCFTRAERNCHLHSEEQQKEQLKGSILKFRSRGRGGGWTCAVWSNSPQLSCLPRRSLARSSVHWWLHVVFGICYHLYGLQQEGYSCLFLIVGFIMSLWNLSFFIAMKYYSGLLSCSGCDQLETRAWDVLICSMLMQCYVLCLECKVGWADTGTMTFLINDHILSIVLVNI